LADLSKVYTALDVVLNELRYVDAQLASERATTALALTKIDALQNQISALQTDDEEAQPV
jgi:hypothetical protein